MGAPATRRRSVREDDPGACWCHRTRDGYLLSGLNLTAPGEGRLSNAANLTAVDVERFLANPAWARSTRATHHGAIRAWSLWLIRTGRRPDDPPSSQPHRRFQRADLAPWPTSNWRSCSSTRMGRRTRAMILLGAYAGLRVSELAAIRGAPPCDPGPAPRGPLASPSGSRSWWPRARTRCGKQPAGPGLRPDRRRRRSAHRSRAPPVQYSLDVLAHQLAGVGSGVAAHQQLVVEGVLVPDRCGDRQPNRLRVKRPAGARATDPAAAPFAGVPRNPGGAVGRATRKLRADRLGQVGDEPLVLLDAPQHLALPTPLPRRRVGQTLPLGLLDGVGFGEDSLALVTPPAPAPPHDDRGQPTLPAGPAGERGVAARQELQVDQVGADRAHRARTLHRQERATIELGRALGARPRPGRRDDEQIGRPSVCHRVTAPTR